MAKPSEALNALQMELKLLEKDILAFTRGLDFGATDEDLAKMKKRSQHLRDRINMIEAAINAKH